MAFVRNKPPRFELRDPSGEFEQEEAARDMRALARGAVEALKKEFGHFIGGGEEDWLRAAMGVLEKSGLVIKVVEFQSEGIYERKLVFMRKEEADGDEVAHRG